MDVPAAIAQRAAIAMRDLSFASYQLSRASQALPNLRWGSTEAGASDALMDAGLVYGRPAASTKAIFEWARTNVSDKAQVAALGDLALSVPVWSDLLLADAARASIVEQTRAADAAADPNTLLKPATDLPSMQAVAARLGRARAEAIAGVSLLAPLAAGALGGTRETLPAA